MQLKNKIITLKDLQIFYRVPKDKQIDTKELFAGVNKVVDSVKPLFVEKVY